jgi:hypothetical protein
MFVPFLFQTLILCSSPQEDTHTQLYLLIPIPLLLPYDGLLWDPLPSRPHQFNTDDLNPQGNLQLYTTKLCGSQPSFQQFFFFLFSKEV